MPVSPAIIKAVSALHECWYRMTGGLIGGNVLGTPILLLTTTGSKTGRRHTTPLVYLEDGDSLVVIASNGGNPKHPAWWSNLKRDPQGEVQVGPRRMAVLAEEAQGQERERLWQAAVDLYSGYAGYQESTDRRIPVVLLRPAG